MKNRTIRNQSTLAGIAVALTVSAILLATLISPARSSGVDIPHSFTAGTPAVAAEVNANFAALQVAVVELQATVTSQQSTIDDQQATIDALEGQVAGIQDSSIMELGSHLEEISSNNFALTGINLHLRNGQGQTASTNGLGNLIIGYNESHPNPINRGRRGSHYLVAGAEHQWTGFGGTVVGFQNTASGAYASVSGGADNTASAHYASVSGGQGNTASDIGASVSGGEGNTANGGYTSVSGGAGNTASGDRASVSGGFTNTASGGWSSILGGSGEEAGNLQETIPN